MINLFPRIHRVLHLRIQLSSRGPMALISVKSIIDLSFCTMVTIFVCVWLTMCNTATTSCTTYTTLE
ncbi:hypothetical protein LINGRAHAP2_LOCUS35073 [Linum grandiflorum]